MTSKGTASACCAMASRKDAQARRARSRVAHGALRGTAAVARGWCNVAPDGGVRQALRSGTVAALQAAAEAQPAASGQRLRHGRGGGRGEGRGQSERRARWRQQLSEQRSRWTRVWGLCLGLRGATTPAVAAGAAAGASGGDLLLSARRCAAQHGAGVQEIQADPEHGNNLEEEMYRG